MSVEYDKNKSKVIIVDKKFNIITYFDNSQNPVTVCCMPWSETFRIYQFNKNQGKASSTNLISHLPRISRITLSALDILLFNSMILKDSSMSAVSDTLMFLRIASCYYGSP
jgi:hypothetical protein